MESKTCHKRLCMLFIICFVYFDCSNDLLRISLQFVINEKQSDIFTSGFEENTQPWIILGAGSLKAIY